MSDPILTPGLQGHQVITGEVSVKYPKVYKGTPFNWSNRLRPKKQMKKIDEIEFKTKVKNWKIARDVIVDGIGRFYSFPSEKVRMDCLNHCWRLCKEAQRKGVKVWSTEGGLDETKKD